MATGEFTAWCSSIRTQVSVASADKEREQHEAIAVWDTGSVYTGISKKLAEEMGLTPQSWKQEVRYANGEVGEENVYHIQIAFPPSGRRADVCAFEFADDSQDILIGMNIIRNGRFVLEPTDDGVRFTFTV